MAGWRRHITTWGAAVAVLAAGGGVFGLLLLTAPAPETNDAPAAPRIVRAFETTGATHRIAMSSYGVARAADELDLRADVEGEITKLHEDFDEGHVLQGGTTIAEIDTTDYQTAYDLALAEVKEQTLRISVLTQREANAKAVLELRQQQVKLSGAELKRAERLLSGGGITPAGFENVQKLHVDNLTALQNLQNELALHPKELAVEQERLRAAELRRDRAKEDLDDCVVKLPYTALCLSKGIELHEKLSKGQVLGQFMKLEKAEVLAMIEPRKALMLFPDVDVFPELDLTHESFNDSVRSRLDEYRVPVDLTWRVGKGQAQWRGRAVRVSPVVDERTRTAPAVIEIEEAFTRIRPGVRPALVPGMFLDVTLYGQTLYNVHVVPRDAVHDEHVYLEREGRLVVQPVKVAATEDDRVVVRAGLEDGDRVILTDVFPVANGMRVAAQVVENPVAHRPGLPELHSNLTPE